MENSQKFNIAKKDEIEQIYDKKINNLKMLLKSSKYAYYYKNLHKFIIYIEEVKKGEKFTLYTQNHNYSQSFIVDNENNLI